MKSRSRYLEVVLKVQREVHMVRTNTRVLSCSCSTSRNFLLNRSYTWYGSAVLNNLSWISGVQEPLPDVSRSTNQRPRPKDRKTFIDNSHRNGHFGPVLALFPLDKRETL